MPHINAPQESSLGKEVSYTYKYNPELLQVIPRSLAREKAQIPSPLPFQGFDIWNCYELSWLTPQGMPQVAMMELWFPSDSIGLVESKSLKLYLNSFNNSYFKDSAEVKACIQNDLEKILDCSVQCKIRKTDDPMDSIQYRSYICLDDQNISSTCYEISPELIQVIDKKPTRQKYYTELLRSCCPVTNQPDWATLFLDFYGPQVCRKSLLQYLISFRNAKEFHEACVERIFTDLMQQGQSERICVYARFVRRGGIDINPLRFNFPIEVENDRTHRQ